MTDPSKVTPGVWEVVHDAGYGKHVVEVYPALTCVLPYGGEHDHASVEEWIRRGWQFTARYVRCDGEPIPCVGYIVENDRPIDDEPYREHMVRGVFIQTEGGA